MITGSIRNDLVKRWRMAGRPAAVDDELVISWATESNASIIAAGRVCSSPVLETALLTGDKAKAITLLRASKLPFRIITSECASYSSWDVVYTSIPKRLVPRVLNKGLSRNVLPSLLFPIVLSSHRAYIDGFTEGYIPDVLGGEGTVLQILQPETLKVEPDLTTFDEETRSYLAYLTRDPIPPSKIAVID